MREEGSELRGHRGQSCGYRGLAWTSVLAFRVKGLGRKIQGVFGLGFWV